MELKEKKHIHQDIWHIVIVDVLAFILKEAAIRGIL